MFGQYLTEIERPKWNECQLDATSYDSVITQNAPEIPKPSQDIKKMTPSSNIGMSM